jgi:hypothetical protein
MNTDGRLDDWMHVIKAEYLEMPGLSLTTTQAQRLWGLDGESAGRLLTILVDEGFLRRTVAGAYTRVTASL